MPDAIIPHLRYLATLIGLRKENMPDSAETLIICESLRTNHGNLTIKELRLAFDMAVGFRLDFNPHAFQTLSVLYLNELLAAYKKWSVQAYHQLRPGGDPAQEREAPDYSPRIYERKSKEWHLHDIERGYRNFLAGILSNRAYIPFDWWQVLVDAGLIELDPDATVDTNPRMNALTPEEKRRLRNGQEMVWLLFEMAQRHKCKSLGLWVLPE
jgi:hypothetical protein